MNSKELSGCRSPLFATGQREMWLSNQIGVLWATLYVAEVVAVRIIRIALLVRTLIVTKWHV